MGGQEARSSALVISPPEILAARTMSVSRGSLGVPTEVLVCERKKVSVVWKLRTARSEQASARARSLVERISHNHATPALRARGRRQSEVPRRAR